MSSPGRIDGLSYVLPLRAAPGEDTAELTAYLRELSGWVEVVVADGSDEAAFAAHAAAWSGIVRHVRPDPLGFANGKVNGVTTGVRLARSDKVVLADDDVRYTRPALQRMAGLLEHAELVRPQNYFDPCPWHALEDTARTLLNRSVGRDYPGTLGLRRSAFLAMGGYDGDVLFENLELCRTVVAAGGRQVAPLDLYVARRPPTAARFRAQRVRQAYDELAQPRRLATYLAVAPAAAALLATGRGRALAAPAGTSVAFAELGRRRAGGREVFPARASLLAPLWLVERGVCVWVALGLRLCGGVRYAGERVQVAANPPRVIRRRLAEGGALPALRPPAAGPEPDPPVAPVAERLQARTAAPA